jgi:hypothetical protein
MAARVIDQASPALKQIQRSLRALSAEAGDAHKFSTAQAKIHTLALHDLRRHVVETGQSVRGILTPAMAGLGIAGLSAPRSQCVCRISWATTLPATWPRSLSASMAARR